MGGGEDKIDLPCFSLTLSQVVITHLHNIVPHVVSYGPPAISVKWLLLLPFSSGVLRLIDHILIIFYVLSLNAGSINYISYSLGTHW